MTAQKDFKEIIIDLEEPDSSKAASVVAGPSVASISWIPFHEDIANLPESDLRNHALAKPMLLGHSAISLMLLSGNPSDVNALNNPSAPSFSDRSQFLDFVRSKNFRAALALDDVRITLNEEERPIKISFRMFATVGYTPMRFGVSTENALHTICYYSKGSGSASAERISEQGMQGVDAWVTFKMSRVPELGFMAFSGRSAPTAVMRIRYLVSSMVSQIKFVGSYIPSQSFYVNWSRTNVHDMMIISAPDIDSFFDAGSQDHAPTGVFQTEYVRHVA